MLSRRLLGWVGGFLWSLLESVAWVYVAVEMLLWTIEGVSQSSLFDPLIFVWVIPLLGVIFALHMGFNSLAPK